MALNYVEKTPPKIESQGELFLLSNDSKQKFHYILPRIESNTLKVASTLAPPPRPLAVSWIVFFECKSRCCSLCTRLPYLLVVVKNNLPNFVTGNKWIDPLHVIAVGWDDCDPHPHDSTHKSVNREETLLSHGFVVISIFLYWPFRQILTKWGHCYWVRHIYSGKEKIDNKKTLFAFHRFLSSWTPTIRKGNGKMVFV